MMFRPIFFVLAICLLPSCLFESALAQKPVFESKVIRFETTGHRTRVSADITKAKRLFLVATDADDGYSFDWADWVKPTLTGPMNEVVDLTEMKWKSARTDWGSAQVNKNCDGGELRVNGERFERGIGVHANSVIEYELPKDHTLTRFQAIAGLDNGGTDQGAGENASVQFLVYVDKLPSNLFGSAPQAGPDHQLENVLGQFDVHPELEVSLFASEPMMVNPTNIDIDHMGRVWVCEVTNYRQFANGPSSFRDEGDRILILEDTDHDGKADKRTVFYQGKDIDSAHGICVLGDRAIVSAGDSVMYLIDNDGDLIADEKKLLFTGIRGSQHDHGIHAFVFGPDGKLYFNFGNEGRLLRDKDNLAIKDLSGNEVKDSGQPYQQGMIFRCNLDGSELETLAWNFRNNWEVCVDSFGRLWQSDNDDDGNKAVRINYVMEHGNYGFRDETDQSGWRSARTGMHPEIPLRHFHQNDPGVVPNLLQTGAGSPTGICIYEGNLLAGVFQNQMIHCDAGPNIVRSYPVSKKGFGFKATLVNLVDGAKHNQWFRPSDVCVAPDGSLIVADWYDPGVGGHRMGDYERGRLFRITPTGKGAAYHVPNFDVSTPEAAAQALCSPNLATRYLAFQNLKEFNSDALESLEALLEGDNPRFAARAIWLISKMDLEPRMIDDYLRSTLNSDNSDLAAMAVRCIRQLPDKSRVNKLLREIDLESCSVEVAREVLIAMSSRNRHDLEKFRNQGFWIIAGRINEFDRWGIEALGIAARGHWSELLDQVESSFWELPASRRIAWRSRGKQTPKLLTRMIRDSRSSEAELLSYFRAFDFLTNQTDYKNELQLIGFETSHSTEEGLGLVMREVIKRMDPKDVNATTEAKINEFLDKEKGTSNFVQSIARLRLSSRYNELMQLLMETQDKQLQVECLNTLFQLGEGKRVRDRLNNEPSIIDFNHLCSALSITGRKYASTLLEEYSKDQSKETNRRKSTISALGDINEGAKLILEWAEANAYDPDLEPAIISALLSSSNREVAARGYELFPVARAKDDRPVPKISELIRQKGEAMRGKTVFEEAGTCIKCHIVNEVGTEVGPDLSQIGSKLSRTAMFESILFPSAGISHGYENWTVQTIDGSLITGLLVSETGAEVKIKNKDGIVQTIQVADIEAKKKQQLSLMPEDLHKEITVQELVDIVEYMQTLKK